VNLIADYVKIVIATDFDEFWRLKVTTYNPSNVRGAPHNWCDHSKLEHQQVSTFAIFTSFYLDRIIVGTLTYESVSIHGNK
jgi:hypothetical protein